MPTLFNLFINVINYRNNKKLLRAIATDARVFSVLHYIMKVTAHYLMLCHFEIHSALELLRMSLLGCRLAALHLHKAACGQ